LRADAALLWVVRVSYACCCCIRAYPLSFCSSSRPATTSGFAPFPVSDDSVISDVQVRRVLRAAGLLPVRRGKVRHGRPIAQRHGRLARLRARRLQRRRRPAELPGCCRVSCVLLVEAERCEALTGRCLVMAAAKKVSSQSLHLLFAWLAFISLLSLFQFESAKLPRKTCCSEAGCWLSKTVDQLTQLVVPCCTGVGLAIVHNLREVRRRAGDLLSKIRQVSRRTVPCSLLSSVVFFFCLFRAQVLRKPLFRPSLRPSRSSLTPCDSSSSATRLSSTVRQAR